MSEPFYKDPNFWTAFGAIGGLSGFASLFFSVYQHYSMKAAIKVDNTWVDQNSLDNDFDIYGNLERGYRLYAVQIPFVILNTGKAEASLIDASIELEYAGINGENFAGPNDKKPRWEWRNVHDFPVFPPSQAVTHSLQFSLWLPQGPAKEDPKRAKIKVALKFIGSEDKYLWYILDLPKKSTFGCHKNENPLKNIQTNT